MIDKGSTPWGTKTGLMGSSAQCEIIGFNPISVYRHFRIQYIKANLFSAQNHKKTTSLRGHYSLHSCDPISPETLDPGLENA